MPVSYTHLDVYKRQLLPGTNTFRAVALNSQRTESLADEVIVNYTTGANAAVQPVSPVNAAVGQIEKSATMHLIVVGINNYKNPKLSLNYALADATAFKIEIEKDSKTILANIKTHFITDEMANKKGITLSLIHI